MGNSGIVIQGGKGDSGPSLIFDTKAGRPAAGTAGRLFVPRNRSLMAVDNGSTWRPVFDGFECEPVVVANQTAINFGSYVSLTQDGDGASFLNSGDANGANYVAASVVAIPGSGAYSLTVGIEVLAFHYTTSSAFLGLCVTDGAGSTPKLDLFYLLSQNTSYSMSGFVQTWTNPTTWQATASTLLIPPFMTNRRFFMKLSDDRNANLTFGIGFDGVNFDALLNPITLARAAFLTPSHIGIMTGHGAASIATGITRMRARIFHWSLTQP
jgi:hypothetical protein